MEATLTKYSWMVHDVTRYSPCLLRFSGGVLPRSHASEDDHEGLARKPGTERLMVMVMAVWLSG